MKQLKNTALCLLAVSSALAAGAQNVTLSKGGAAKYDIVKGSEPVTFSANGDRYIFSKFTKTAMRNYSLYSYNPTGALNTYANLEYDLGVFNSTYEIDDLVKLGGKVYATVEHLDKKGSANTLTIREVSKTGDVSKEETELMNIPFTKIMNSGFNHTAVSPDGNTLAVVGEMPFEKEQPQKIKIATFDKELNKLKNAEITLPGENTKNKTISVAAANNGTVYLIKRTTSKKGEIELAVYQWSPGASDVKEYVLNGLTDPLFITSYAYETNTSNEIVVSGIYYQRRTVSTGDKEMNGGFYFTNKGGSEGVFKSFAFDKPVENLVARKVLINDNTVFLAAEQFKEEKESPPPGAPLGAEWNYTYKHKSEYIIGMDTEGNKKFQLELAKDFTARNMDQQFYSAYYLTGGKLTVVYNDQGNKYGTYGHVPVLVQITNDGLMQSPVVFKDKLQLESGFTLFPAHSVKDSENQLSFLMGNGTDMKLLTVKMDKVKR